MKPCPLTLPCCIFEERRSGVRGVLDTPWDSEESEHNENADMRRWSHAEVADGGGVIAPCQLMEVDSTLLGRMVSTEQGTATRRELLVMLTYGTEPVFMFSVDGMFGAGGTKHRADEPGQQGVRARKGTAWAMLRYRYIRTYHAAARLS